MFIDLTGHGQAIAAVPYLVGYYPTDDVIVVLLKQDELTAAMRRHSHTGVRFPLPDGLDATTALVIAYGSDDDSFASASRVAMVTANEFASPGRTVDAVGVLDEQWAPLEGLGEPTIWSPIPSIDADARNAFERAGDFIRERRAVLAPRLTTVDDLALAIVAITMAADSHVHAAVHAHRLLRRNSESYNLTITDIAALIKAAPNEAFIAEATQAIRWGKPNIHRRMWTAVVRHAAGNHLTWPLTLTAYAAWNCDDLELCNQALSLIRPSQLTPAAYELLDLMNRRH